MNPQGSKAFLQPIRQFLVCLDLTDIDAYLIRYAASLARTLSVERVIFFHVIQAYDLPDRADKSFPDVETELRDLIRKNLLKSVDDFFKTECHWEIETRVGYEDAAKEVIGYIQESGSDLTLLGQKYGENRQARYSRKILTETACDILFVPQITSVSLQPVVCAVDFSEESGSAFEKALDISRAEAGSMSCYFVSDPTRAYFPATTQRSSDRDLRRFQETYEQFLKSYGLSPDDIPCRIEVHEAISSEAEAIHQTASEQNARLIVVGARGDAAKMTSLFGNLCETFRIMEKELPVMLVKPQPRKKTSWFRKGSSWTRE
jgi:nucleotide-binding universal stress UspA family protein